MTWMGFKDPLEATKSEQSKMTESESVKTVAIVKMVLVVTNLKGELVKILLDFDR